MADGSSLFEEIEQHLLSDEKPSRFLSELAGSSALGEYPFDMLKRLQPTPQSPRYHPEGSAWNHTLLVVDEAAGIKTKSADPRAFMWAALLHDIGKPSTTVRRNGKITSYDHDKAGALLTREFLGVFTADMDFIERTAQLVRYHMQILFVGRNLPFADLEGMKRNTDVREIALLGLCDRLGRQGADRQQEQENIRTFLEVCNSQSGGRLHKAGHGQRGQFPIQFRHGNSDVPYGRKR
ncbi:HDIG domain-containing metalloprotein [Oscillibacter sp.]|uniref:HDIG domain-containing metalloprotein n=1 Tax=Oscillibacter sp. TaxID=1945593 RepID=UPI003395C822